MRAALHDRDYVLDVKAITADSLGSMTILAAPPGALFHTAA
jgi:hypothetical protein